jgi:RHS repeat-associated protein
MPLAVAANDNQGVSQLTWVHANHMGVPIRYSDVSGNTLAAPTRYSVPGFPGQSQTTADLYYNRYRDYDTVTGRYIQADPIGLAGGPSPYSYAFNNPLRYTDPTGEIVNILIGGLAGGGMDLIEQLIENGGNWRCIDKTRLLTSTVLGAATGGLGGRGLQASLRGLSNRTKGRIGEGLSEVENRLRLSRRVRQNAIDGYRTKPDSVWDSLFGNRYYVESKFGKSTLTSAQRAAQDGLGDRYHVERWSYDFFGRVGGYGGGAAGWGEGEQIDSTGCECQ